MLTSNDKDLSLSCPMMNTYNLIDIPASTSVIGVQRYNNLQHADKYIISLVIVIAGREQNDREKKSPIKEVYHRPFFSLPFCHFNIMLPYSKDQEPQPV